MAFVETVEYRSWCRLKTRSRDYNIKISDRIYSDFEYYFSLVGSKPSENHFISLVDKKKGYIKGNIFWDIDGDFHKYRAYTSWRSLKRRILEPQNNRYKMYTERGITLCERWIHSFPNFLEDMGERPEGKFSIDRIDNNKGYYKENCRWATPKEQALNRRSTTWVDFGDNIILSKRDTVKLWGVTNYYFENNLKEHCFINKE